MSTTPDPVALPVVPAAAEDAVAPSEDAAEPSENAAAPSEDAAAPSEDAAEPRRRRLVALLATLTVAVLLVDQLTKVWAIDRLASGDRVDLIGDLLGLRLLFNPGAALSIATGQTWLLTLVALTVVVVIVRSARRLGSTAWAVALGLLLGGALGNLWDRMLRQPGFARGHVVDFIAYADWFVGNVADVAIVVAAGMIMVLAATGVRLDGTRERHADDAAAEGELAEDPDVDAADLDATDPDATDLDATDVDAADLEPETAAPDAEPEPDAEPVPDPEPEPTASDPEPTPSDPEVTTPRRTGKARRGA